MGEKILSETPFIDEGAKLIDSNLGKYTEISTGCRLENTLMDDYSYCDDYCIIQNAVIGKFVNIAAMVRIGATQHPMDRPTLHHFTYRRKLYGFDVEDDNEFFEKRKKSRVVIGNDVWIGHGAIIMNGVTIGNGAIIGSGAVVTKDVERYSIVAGVPAVKLRNRFDKDISEKLESIKWWNWSYKKIKDNFNDFLLDKKDFIEKYYESR
ncbi:MAG: DapH/DapD/GlmU-related protein [Clostridium sp.]